ncbi:MAG TPA: hypothetical protein VFZ73_12810, partial [Gemmatimonadaceae bacterium]
RVVAPVAARVRLLALALASIAVVGIVVAPSPRITGPAFTAPIQHAHQVADSMVRSRGVDPTTWRRLTAAARDTQLDFRAFLRRHDAESLATQLAGSYAIPAWWIVRYVRPEASLAERVEEWRARVLPDGRPLDLRHVIGESEPRDAITAASARQIALAAVESTGVQGALLEIDLVETPRPGRRDFTLTFADTAVALPDAATARLTVSLAGPEVLSVRRGIQLPQAFLRQARGEFANAMTVAGFVTLPALALLIWGMVRSRRLPVAATDDLPRRALVAFLIVLAVSSIASSLLDLPSDQALYDTAVPWRTFLASVTGTQVMSLVGAFVFAALWLLANGMRRRAGIPLVAGAPTGRAMSDDLLAGLALGGIPGATGAIGRIIPSGAMSSVPHTTLDSAVPLLTRVVEVLPDAVGTMLAISLPALALYTFSHRPAIRWSVSVLFLLLAGTAVLSFRSSAGTDAGFARLAWTLVAAAVFIVGLLYWGRVSVLSWLLGAVFASAISNLSFALHAPTGVERGSGLLAMLLAVAILAAGNLFARRQQPRPAWSRAGPNEDRLSLEHPPSNAPA